ncbi:Renalase [Dissostichus eleginoides]|uniref:Renalase n=1 Tax=Dissostichus eleginoides TaxID=100907 RepID=A0AAD9BDC3_DISEL|nr:Renalase [Dissostichus eleginoides]
MARVLIVGAGLTGSLCASLLRRELQDKVRIEVWEKSRGSADLGAQYITATSAYRKSHHRLYAELLSAGVLLPFDSSRIEGLKHKDGSQDFITPLGMGSAEVFFERHVTGLFRRGASWEVQSRAGDSEMFDAVVLTIPQQQLSSVLFSSRFALALFFPPDASFSFSWAARYVRDSSVIVYICHDSAKRNAAPSLGPSLVVHSSVPFGLAHLERDAADVQPIIMQELQRLLPGLPQPISIKCHKWRYSQVLTGMPGSPGHMTLLQFPLLLCAGDGFSHSNFDGCVESALSTITALRGGLSEGVGLTDHQSPEGRAH